MLLSKLGFFLSRLTASLQSPDFRLYFGGMLLSLVGTWMQQIAMSWLVYELTGSLVSLATITFLAQIPILLVTPFLSLLVDRYDRRKLLIITQSLSAIQAFLLAWITLTGIVQVWHLMALSLFLGLVNALDNPTRQAFYPSLVDKSLLGNAIALNSAVINGSRLFGPAIGGMLIATVGCGICFLINSFSFGAVLLALCYMHSQQRSAEQNNEHPFCALQNGFSYIIHHTSIRTLLLLMAGVSMFALPLMTFIPAYTKEILQGDSRMLGSMLSTIGIGSFTAALYLAARRGIDGLDNVIGISITTLGVAIVMISYTTSPLIAHLLGTIIGFTIITAVASINTLLQSLSNERMRGRVMGYMAMTFTGVSPLGGLFLAQLESYISLPHILMISGLTTFSIALIYNIYRLYFHSFIINKLC